MQENKRPLHLPDSELDLVLDARSMRAIEQAAIRDDEWRTVTSFSDFLFLLTREEAASLVADIHEVLNRYRPLHESQAAHVPDGARVFELQLHAYPRETD